MPSITQLRAATQAACDAGITHSNTFISYNPHRGKPIPVWLGKPLPKSHDPRHVAVKDNIATRKLPTTCASAILRSHQSPFEADVITRLAKRYIPGYSFKGSMVIGKTNMDEFGMGSHSANSFFGPVRNIDHFPLHSVGGSSGGSAVAVASGQCVVALGTDTGGSIRLPAAYMNIVGFKPSYGLISRWGVIPYANSLDTVGLLATSVRTIRLAFKHISAFDSKDPTSISQNSRARIDKHRLDDLSQEWERRKRNSELYTGKTQKAFTNMKVGVPLEYNISELDSDVRQAWQDALELLQDNGATIVPISLPNTKHALSAYYVLAPAEAASNLSKYDGVRYGTRSGARDGAGDVLYSDTRGAGFGDEVRRRILLGSYTLSSEAVDNYFIKAQKVRRLVQRDFDRVFAISNPLRKPEQFDLSNMDQSICLEDKLGPPQVDFIVCPTAPTFPPTLDVVTEQTPVDTYMNDVFTVPASLAGLPAISVPFPVPASRRASGRPAVTGIQFIGQYSDDDRVLRNAQYFEKFLKDSANVSPIHQRPVLKLRKVPADIVNFKERKQVLLGMGIERWKTEQDSLAYILEKKELLQRYRAERAKRWTVGQKSLEINQEKQKARQDPLRSEGSPFDTILEAWENIARRPKNKEAPKPSTPERRQ
ncbi:glutamyl-tRNA(Gln) amidotransferase subunit A [Diplocarpon rosae]|nr:glutamyl-tRNA(Gln) amidotransferase subunit A [Diplocarpon rosae]